MTRCRRQTWQAQEVRLRDGRTVVRNVREALDPLWVDRVFVRYGMARVDGGLVALRAEQDFTAPGRERLPLVWTEVEPLETFARRGEKALDTPPVLT